MAPIRSAWGEEKQPRVSTTDPDLPVMKMGDGGFHPAVNAHARNRGLYQFKVRGLTKICTVALIQVPAHNLMRAHALRTRLA